MDRNNTDISNKTKIRNIALNGIMLALIVALQATNLPNFITGIIVNGIIVFILLNIGLKSALVIGLLSPLFGFFTGHVPVFMYPVLPMIALGNNLFVIVLHRIVNSSIWLKMFLPAFIKALVIGLGGWLMVYYFIPNKIQDFIVLSILGIHFFTAVPGIGLGIMLSKRIKY